MQVPNSHTVESTGRPEQLTIEVFNSQGAVIPQYSPVCYSSLVFGTGAGYHVTLPATATLNFFAGVTLDTINTGERGHVVRSGIAKVRAWGIAGWDASKTAIVANGLDYVVFGTPTAQLHHTYSITSLLANTSVATTTIDVDVRSL